MSSNDGETSQSKYKREGEHWTSVTLHSLYSGCNFTTGLESFSVCQTDGVNREFFGAVGSVHEMDAGSNMGGMSAARFSAPCSFSTMASANSNVVPGPRDVITWTSTLTRSSVYWYPAKGITAMDPK